MSILYEGGTRQRDILSALLDSLDVQCSLIEEISLPEAGETSAGDVGPVFYAVTEGTCWFHRPGVNPVELNGGDLLVLSLGGVHGLSNAPTSQLTHSDRRASQDVATMGIPGERKEVRLLRGHVRHLAPSPHPFFLGLPSTIHLKDSTNTASQPVLAAAIRAMRYIAREPTDGAGSIMNLLGQLLVLEAIRSTVASQEFVQPGLLRPLSDPELAPTLALVYRAPAREWTLESLAHEAGMSRSSFTRRFKELMGIPAMTWITDLRMRMASNLLADPARGLQQVAAKAGYASATSFSAAFKRWAGHAPSQRRGRSSIERVPRLEDRHG